MSFNKFGLSPEVVRGTQAMGFAEPTPIQLRAFPIVLAGKDLIGTAQTGTGKTAAFALPILTLLAKHGAFRCLVLEPTRELAAQVETAFRDYGRFTDLRVALVHGGVGYGKQREELKRGVDILAATPGRLLDLLEQRTTTLKSVNILVLDEVDRMLDMGFLPDVRRIVEKISTDRQTLLFSATLPPEIERLAGYAPGPAPPGRAGGYTALKCRCTRPAPRRRGGRLHRPEMPVYAPGPAPPGRAGGYTAQKCRCTRPAPRRRTGGRNTAQKCRCTRPAPRRVPRTTNQRPTRRHSVTPFGDFSNPPPPHSTRQGRAATGRPGRSTPGVSPAQRPGRAAPGVSLDQVRTSARLAGRRPETNARVGLRRASASIKPELQRSMPGVSPDQHRGRPAPGVSLDQARTSARRARR